MTRKTPGVPDRHDLTVVKVDLDVEGISDDYETDTGSFVIINDDDDDEDGTADKDETSGNISGENDRIELTMQEVLPSSLPDTDTVSLTWTGGTRIAIYESSDDTNSISSGETYTLNSLPKILYLEGNSVGSSTVSLTYSKGGGTDTDSVIITVGQLGFYRDSACTNALDDHAKDGDLLRSPKYIFGEEDDIYAKVTGLSGRPSNYYDVEVENLAQSESVNLDMIETTSGTYKNTGSGDELYLSTTTTASGTGEYIKVIDEEVLSFIVKVNGVEIGEKSVMVDKGEYAMATNSPNDIYGYWYDIREDLEPPLEDDLKWWSNGDVKGPSETFVCSAGNGRLRRAGEGTPLGEERDRTVQRAARSGDERRAVRERRPCFLDRGQRIVASSGDVFRASGRAISERDCRSSLGIFEGAHQAPVRV